jgi:hypothetical protein
MKEKFDRQIGELIDLRENYGVEYANREAVSRGKQLSKDLLLTYKNLSKLGVLSRSDEAIVNAIIPGDPLGQDWMPGQDSILSNLKSFKADLADDYATTVRTRLQNGAEVSKGLVSDRAKKQDGKLLNGSAIAGTDKTEVSRKYSPSRKQTKITYSDGTEEIIDD